MDPLSAAANMAGLITLASSAVRLCYTYLSTVNDYHREVQAITNEVTQLFGLLHAIQPLLNDGAESQGPDLLLLSMTDRSQNCVTEAIQPILPADEIDSCKRTLEEITEILGKLKSQDGKSLANITRKLQWPLRRPGLQTFLERLERHKTTFTLVFSARGMSVIPGDLG